MTLTISLDSQVHLILGRMGDGVCAKLNIGAKIIVSHTFSRQKV